MLLLQYENDELAEEYKICSFIDMVEDSHRIGIPHEGNNSLKIEIFSKNFYIYLVTMNGN